VPLNVTAMDVNVTANAINKFNFPSKNVQLRNLMSLSADEVDKMDLDLLTMSPPCQPFTR